MKEKKFEKKAELLEAALSEFTEKSFEDASLNTILKHAGISKGTFYYHFPDKEALYLFLLEQANQAKWEFIRARLKEEETETEGKTIFDLMRRQAKLGAEFALRYPRYHKLSQMLRKEKGKPVELAVRRHFGADTDAALAEMIDRAVDSGEFRRSYPRQFLLRLFSFLLSGFDEVFRAEENESLEQVLRNLDDYMDFMQFGLSNQRRETN